MHEKSTNQENKKISPIIYAVLLIFILLFIAIGRMTKENNSDSSINNTVDTNETIEENIDNIVDSDNNITE